MSEHSETVPSLSRRAWLLLFALFALALAVGGYLFYRYEIEQLRRERYNDLQAIGGLKINQILSWREEEIYHVSQQVQTPLFAEAVTEFLAGSAGARPVQGHLHLLRSVHNYKDVLLLDLEGEILLSASGAAAPPPPATIARVREAGAPIITDIHRGDEGHIFIDVLGTLHDPASEQPLALVLLRNDPFNYLFPLLQRWPWPSETGETLLVRREGDEVVFLNELRHRGGAPLSLRVPLAQRDLPAVQAVLGKEGMVIGRDYRGERVLAHVAPVPGSNWFLVAKWDLAEMAAETGSFALRITLFLAMMLASGGILLGYLDRRRQAQLFRTLYRAEREQHRLLEERRAILDSIGDGVIATDAAGRISYLNEVAAALTGYGGAEARGRPLREVFTIVDARTCEPLALPLDSVLAEGETAHLPPETLLIARDGREWPIADSAAPVRDAQGEIAGAVLTFRDVGERQRMEAAVRASERRYRELFANGLSGVAVYDVIRDERGRLVDFRLVDANPAFATETGLDAATVRGRRAGEVFGGLDDALLEGISRWLDGPRQALTVEHYFAPLDRYFFVNAYQLGTEQFAAVFQDITERKQAEARLRDRHAELAQVLAAMPEALVYTNDERRIERVNRAFVDIFGYRPEEALGRTTAFLYAHQDDYREQGKKRYDPESGARYDPYEIEYRRKNGEIFTGETVGSPIRDGQGKVWGMLGLVRDVSARKEAEAEKQRLQEQLARSQKIESIGRLAGGVAHDFNNMLAVIMGNTELALRRLKMGAPLAAELEEIREAAQRSSTLTRQLLAFARKQPVDPRVVDLNATVAGMLAMLERLLGEGIELLWQPAAGLWPVKVDPAQVDQILANLCVNARDAISGAGRITVETGNAQFDEAYCRANAGYQPGAYVLLAVSDNGRGMDRETLSHVFEPFFTTKEVGEGTGLGLATVYGIASQNGGFVAVDSEPGAGSTFRVYLPRHDGPVPAPTGSEPVATPAGGTQTILVVEDEPAILDVVHSLLEMEGYNVLAAGEPRVALRLAEAHAGQIDLLLTDVVMPGMSGRELADRLAAAYPGLRCLFMSGYTADAIAEQGVLAEGVYFLQKPFLAEDLLCRVRELVEPAPGK